jgi:hypothetical protein
VGGAWSRALSAGAILAGCRKCWRLKRPLHRARSSGPYIAHSATFQSYNNTSTINASPDTNTFAEAEKIDGSAVCWKAADFVALYSLGGSGGAGQCCDAHSYRDRKRIREQFRHRKWHMPWDFRNHFILPLPLHTLVNLLR